MRTTGASPDEGALSGAGRPWLTLWGMVFAVSMVFIDMTIVAIAVPQLQQDLGLSATGVQWVITGYLVSTAALIAFGGRLADIYGARRLVVIGVVIFAVGSAMSGATPTGSLAEPWIITFRVIQGAGGALMVPAALALVINSFALHERGRATAIFIGITGAMTAVGPVVGGYLTEWTWRAIFWVNIPVAVMALVVTAIARPDNTARRQRLDLRGLLLIAGGMALTILGLQEASDWGCGAVSEGGRLRLRRRAAGRLLRLRWSHGAVLRGCGRRHATRSPGGGPRVPTGRSGT